MFRKVLDTIGENLYSAFAVVEIAGAATAVVGLVTDNPEVTKAGAVAFGVGITGKVGTIAVGTADYIIRG